MARIKINIPKNFHFTTHMTVRFGDIAGGVHLGNHVLITYLNEAMFGLLNDNGFPGFNVEGNAIIVADVAVVYKSESHHKDVLRIDVAVGDFNKYGCDLLFNVTNENTGKKAAEAKMGMVFFDYETKKLTPVPEKFRAIFT